MKRTRKFSPEYLAYLESPAWNLKRAQKIVANGSANCEECGRAQLPRECQCHHLTYERLGNEDLADLRILCARCHDEAEHMKEIKAEAHLLLDRLGIAKNAIERRKVDSAKLRAETRQTNANASESGGLEQLASIISKKRAELGIKMGS